MIVVAKIEFNLLLS